MIPSYICISTLFVIVVLFAFFAERSLGGHVIFATADVPDGYEIVKVISSCSVFSDGGSSRSFSDAYSKAWSQMEAEARRLKVAAVLEIRVNLSGTAGADAGKIVIRGAAVRCSSPVAGREA